TDILPEFVLTTIDQAVSRANGNPGGPVHINCMYREPLAPVKTRSKWASYIKTIQKWEKGSTVYSKYVLPKPLLGQSDIDHVTLKIGKIKSGLIVVGKLKNLMEQKNVLMLAEKLRWPIFADISSGLRLGNTHKNVIHYFDQILLSDKLKKNYKPDGILHLGGRITSKRWYEYVEESSPKQYIMVLKHPLRNDPQHKVTTRIQCDITSFCHTMKGKIPQRKKNRLLLCLQKLNREVHLKIDDLLKTQIGLSEMRTARCITESIPSNDGLFISSSMPIREIDMYGAPDKNKIVFGSNRGASGIDGTIATAIGFSTGLKKRCTLLIGDLAFLHDLNSMAMVRDLKHPMIIVVINNNGGGIFSFLPVKQSPKNFEKYFGTPHYLTFSAAADLFDLNYARPETNEEFAKTYAVALKS
ncbi:MAG: 2-succinyl-5-enolpyruvyl-6-hydroxy-3-cyclohexene-1-carboxylate synthase, partial [Candidatus Omnitrophica bacterium]|nr:2-succinyl-5-enolpyruvyl-6-hydroxy-3-cyclohexene-1-carboxylate synthase [Candidatus Omnitrophota bacterium]